MELISNCSEFCERIDLTKLNTKEKKLVLKWFNNMKKFYEDVEDGKLFLKYHNIKGNTMLYCSRHESEPDEFLKITARVGKTVKGTNALKSEIYGVEKK